MIKKLSIFLLLVSVTIMISACSGGNKTEQTVVDLPTIDANTETELNVWGWNVAAKALIESKDYIVLNYFEKELNYQEKKYFERLWKKLVNDFDKTIIIFTNDLTSIWNIAKELIIVDKYKVINTIPKDKYIEFIDDLNKPEIIKFIELIKKKGIEIESYKEVNELLKAIYRIKEHDHEISN